jgi:hypothetical protein
MNQSINSLTDGDWLFTLNEQEEQSNPHLMLTLVFRREL